MRWICTTGFVVVFCFCFHMQVWAESLGSRVNTEAEKAAVAIEANINKLKKSVSGTVRETDTGLILDTDEGVYKLKGLSIKDIRGKEVRVTGVVKRGKTENVIYVVQAGIN